MKKKILLVALVVPAILSAQPIGYAFLRTSVGARPSAMAASFVAISNDPHCIFYNPAGIASLQKRSAAFGYLNHILDIQNFSGAYVMPMRNGNLGAGVQYTSYGEFERTDELGVEQGAFGVSSAVIYLSYAQTRGQRVQIGANVKYIRSELENFTSDAYALDLGVIYHSSLLGNLDIGGGVFNVGGIISPFDQTKERLPFNYQIGVSKRLEHLPLHYSLALVGYSEEDLRFRAGGEITLSTGLFFRLGYDTLGGDQKVGTTSDRFAGLSFGLGLEYRQYKFDYGLSSFGEIGSLNRLSLSMTF